MRRRSWLAAVTSLALLGTVLTVPSSSAQPAVSIVLNGQRLSLDPAPVIIAGRTLVPLRGVFQAMGATVDWNEADRTVTVRRGGRYVEIEVDRKLACLNEACTSAAIMDVPATILDNRTYVPVRFISTALGVQVVWDDGARTVYIDTAQAPPPQVSPVRLEGVTWGMTISRPVSLRASGMPGEQVFFYLVDPATRKGITIAAGTDVSASYTYTPDPAVTGTRLLVAAVRDAAGTLHYSDPVPVTIRPDTRLTLTGVTPGQTIPGPITLGHEIHFAASRVTYRVLDDSGNVWNIATVGPGDSLTWYPHMGLNGPKKLQVVAYDRNENMYASDPVPVIMANGPRTAFSSVKEGEVITGRARTLSVSANYDIASVRWLLDGNELGTGNSFWWTYGPDDNGAHTLEVEVTDTAGNVHRVGPIPFTIDTRPGLWLYGVGPNQVVTGELSLMAMPNIPADTIKFFVREGGQDMLIAEAKPGETVKWTPQTGGQKTIYAQAWHQGSWVASTEPIRFEVYLGPTYSARPIVAKSEFIDFIAPMAIQSRNQTGMSAALQVAQAILETGWGQYVPVDKYTGQFSYNLFGMKGSGPAGSIISTTWEVYNGQSYTVDDAFRAYYSVEQNWQDHKDLLLTRSWYAPFRAVMADPVLGAWGLKRSGYATDPEYPTKLIRIMRENDLFRLDEIPF